MKRVDSGAVDDRISPKAQHCAQLATSGCGRLLPAALPARRPKPTARSLRPRWTTGGQPLPARWTTPAPTWRTAPWSVDDVKHHM